MRPATALLFVSLLANGCGGSSPSSPSPTPAATPAPAAPAVQVEPIGSGSVLGGVRARTEAPDPVLPPEADLPGCPPGPRPALATRSGSAGLIDVIVRLRRGPQSTSPGSPPPPPPAATHALALDGCLLSPRALVARVGDTLQLNNGDDRFHALVLQQVDGGREDRVQTLPLAPKQQAVSYPLRQPGLYRLRSDQIPSLGGLLLVLRPDELGAVSGEDGSIALDPVPAGSWDVEVHHDGLGALQTSVEVLPGEVTALTGELGT